MKAKSADLVPDYFALACAVLAVSFMCGPVLLVSVNVMQAETFAHAIMGAAGGLVAGLPIGAFLALFIAPPLLIYAMIAVFLTYRIARQLLPNTVFGSALYGVILTIPVAKMIDPHFADLAPLLSAGALAGLSYFRFHSGHWLFATRSHETNLA